FRKSFLIFIDKIQHRSAKVYVFLRVLSMLTSNAFIFSSKDAYLDFTLPFYRGHLTYFEKICATPPALSNFEYLLSALDNFINFLMLEKKFKSDVIDIVSLSLSYLAKCSSLPVETNISNRVFRSFRLIREYFLIHEINLAILIFRVPKSFW